MLGGDEMRRPLLLAIMVCGVMVVAQAPAPSPPVPAWAQGVQRVEYLSPVPSCAEGIKQLGLEGRPVSARNPRHPPTTRRRCTASSAWSPRAM